MAETVYRLRKAGSIDPNPMTFTTRARAFTGSLEPAGTSALVVARRGGAIESWLVTPQGVRAESSAIHLATSVGARAEACPEGVPDEVVSTPVVGWLEALPLVPPARLVSAGVDPGETSRLLAPSLPEGCWAAVVLRRPTRAEAKRWPVWMSWRMRRAGNQQAHPSLGQHQMVCSVVGGAPSAGELGLFLPGVVNALQMFDMPTRVRVASRWSAAMGLLGMAAVAAVVCGAAVVLPLVAGSFVAQAPPMLLVMLRALAAVAAVVLIGMAVGASRRVSGRGRAWPNPLLKEAFPSPPRRVGVRWRRPREASQRTEKDGSVVQVREFAGDYPLHAASFMVGAEQVVALVAPQAGAESGAATTSSWSVPPAVLDDGLGPSFGSSQGRAVSFDPNEMRLGVGLLGEPGSGKSRLLEAMYGWSCAERVRPSGLPGAPGANNALLVFDTKGDEWRNYVRWSSAAGDRCEVLFVNDDGGPALNMFGEFGSVVDRATQFVSSMVYAWGEGDIQGRSDEVLTANIAGGLVVTPSVASQVEGLDPTGSPVYFAHVLNGGRSAQKATELHAALVREWEQVADVDGLLPASRDLRSALDQMAPIFTGMTEAKRQEFCQAARNKTKVLVSAEAWFRGGSQVGAGTFESLLVHNRNVVVSFSSRGGVVMDEQVSAKLTAMMMFTLYNAIRRVCEGWAAHGRYVSLFSPELTYLAGASDTVVEWIRDKGRAFGVRPHYATQRIGQLTPGVAQVFLTSHCLVSFMQPDPVAAAQVAAQMSTRMLPDDVMNLQKYHALVRTFAREQRLEPFEVLVRDMDAQMADVLRAWGVEPREAVVEAGPVPQASPERHADGFAPWAAEDVSLPGPAGSPTGVDVGSWDFDDDDGHSAPADVSGWESWGSGPVVESVTGTGSGEVELPRPKGVELW